MYQEFWLIAWHVACSYTCTDTGSIMQKRGRTERTKNALFVTGRVLCSHTLRMDKDIKLAWGLVQMLLCVVCIQDTRPMSAFANSETP